MLRHQLWFGHCEMLAHARFPLRLSFFFGDAEGVISPHLPYVMREKAAF